MNKKTVSGLQEGEKFQLPLLVTQMTKGVTTAGAPYLSLVVQDKTGSLDGKLWDVKEEQVRLIEPGRILLVIGEVLKYRNTLQLRIHNVQQAPLDVDPSDFVSTGPIPVEELKSQITSFFAQIEDPIYKQITQACFDRYEQSFYQYPAAARNHHDFLSGLATHVVAMLHLASDVCNRYPLLNRDLLYSGILLHDLGKVLELSGPVLTEYTLQGKLLGHISMMQSIVYEMAVDLKIEDSEQVTCLRHLILSHHGQYEYGSPVLPMMAEAEVLHLIDNLDARLNMFEKMYEDVEPQNFSQRIFSLENRSFYRSK